jgi:peptidoglycan/xylan/chitin deacetylase (PgdA/CDA1 family)
MYHRFADVAGLRAQCEHLRRHYRPLSLTALTELLNRNSALPENALVITIDDGYADFAAAFEIFRAFDLPVTLYVVSEFIDGRQWLWPDQVEKAFLASPRVEAAIELPAGNTLRCDLTGPAGRRRAIVELDEAIIRMRNEERLAVLGKLPALLDVSLPEAPPSDCRALSWDQLRTMAAQGLDIGAHTRTHPILASLTDERAVVDEIAGSKRRIAEAAGVAVRHFCYPNGRRADYTETSVRAAREAGYESAVVTEPGMVDGAADLFQLPRIGVEPDLEPLYFERCVAGFRR